MVEVSIVIASLKKPEELFQDIKKQTFKDYEIVLVTGKMQIPRAYNIGFRRAKGKKIVIVESDVRIYDKNWLANMVKAIDKYKVVKVDQVEANNFVDTPNNVGIDARIAKAHMFDESIIVGEDIDWYEKIRQDGYEFKRLRQPVVWHFKKWNPKKYVMWKFWIGVSYSKTALQYRNANMNFKRIILSRALAFLDFLLMLIGEICGFIRYFYLIFYRKKTTKRPTNLSKLFNADD